MFCTSFDAKKRIWSGPKLPMLFNERLSVGQALLRTLQGNPQKIRQISANNGIELTNADIHIRTIRAAQNIKRLGLKEGDVIGVAARNSHNMAPIVFAGMCIGCPVHALDPTFDIIELTGLLSITKPKLLFCDLSNLDTVETSLSDVEFSPILFTFDGASAGRSRAVDEILSPSPSFEECAMNGLNPAYEVSQQVAVMLSTSGSTDSPKVVCISHAALLDGAMNWTSLRTDDIVLSSSSLCWLLGMCTLITGTLNGCTRVITTDSFEPGAFLQIVEKYKVSVIVSVPHYMSLAIEHPYFEQADISSIREYIGSGTSIPRTVYTRLGLSMRIRNTYALTEMFGAISSTLFTNSDSVGQLGSNVTVKIVDENGESCGVEENGEICIRVTHPFLRYYGNATETTRAFDTNGWFKSGDIGHFDGKSNLHLVGRKDGVFKVSVIESKALNTPSFRSSEIETVLIEHPAIMQACVVEVPTVRCGFLPAVAIVLKNSANVTKRDIEEFLDRKLLCYRKIQAGIYFVDSFPMSPSGNVLRRALSQIVFQKYSIEFADD